MKFLYTGKELIVEDKFKCCESEILAAHMNMSVITILHKIHKFNNVFWALFKIKWILIIKLFQDKRKK